MEARPVGQCSRRNQEGAITMGAIGGQAAQLQREWETDPRWAGITRDYSAQDVIGLRDCAAGEHGLAQRGASRLWDLLHNRDAGPALGAVVGDHPVQAAGAGLDAIYLPGPQAAGQTDAFELMTAMIEAGAAGVCFEDLLPSAGARAASGHVGEKVLVPTGQHIETLTAARLAADVLGVPSLVIARTGAHAASLLTSDIDERDHEFLTGERTAEGFHRTEPGWYACVTRALAFAPYADLLWLDTPAPDLAVARAFACIIHSQHPDKLLAYSCPPPFAGRTHQSGPSIAKFRQELAAMGYQFQSAAPAGPPAAGGSTSELDDRYPRDAPAYA
jgi:isocitrate lyase